MKSFQQFQEDINQRRAELAQAQREKASAFVQKSREKAAAQREKIEAEQEAENERKKLKDEIKRELSSEAYDASFMSGAQVRKTGEGGRIGSLRKKSEPERRRVRAVGGGKTEPVAYKPRKDIGTQRKTETRVQQPQKERGSAEVKQTYAQKVAAERKKAAQARIAARKAGTTPTQEKPKAKEVAKTASKLLATKKPEKPVSPDYKPQEASGMTRKERDRARNKAKRELYNQRKAKLFADYKETTGKSPTGKERTRLLGLAQKSL